jgi:hypothetical protein
MVENHEMGMGTPLVTFAMTIGNDNSQILKPLRAGDSCNLSPVSDLQ